MQTNNQDNNSTVILVVEGNTPFRTNLCDILELEGYVVLTASTIAAGLQILRTAARLPRLILCDILMKPMNGYQFLRTIRAERQWDGIDFILTSTTPGLKDTATSEYSGTKKPGVLTKPFGVPKLMEMIQETISALPVAA